MRRGRPRAVGAGALALLVTLAGCGARLGRVPGLLGAQAYPPVMVLATGVVGETCRTGTLGASEEGALAAAIEQALATVPEATVLVDATVETRPLTIDLVNRRCVRVRGSAAKLVRSIVLPAEPSHHEGHH